MEDLEIIELYFSRDEQAITETDRFPISAGQFFLLLFLITRKTQKITKQTNRKRSKYINDRVLFQENGRQAYEYGRNDKRNMPAYVFFPL